MRTRSYLCVYIPQYFNFVMVGRMKTIFYNMFCEFNKLIIINTPSYYKKYDQGIPQSHAADKPTAHRRRATEHLQSQNIRTPIKRKHAEFFCAENVSLYTLDNYFCL